MSRLTSALLLAILTFSAGTAIGAQTAAPEYPTRPIRMLIPFAPGGATDIIARILEPKLSKRLGQQVVVDNRTGAAGNIAVELTAQAQPDGYTLLVGNISTNSINPILFAKTMKVNALKDLRGVSKLVAIPNFILGSPKLPANTLKEALDYAKARPGQLNVASVATGSSQHLMGELFNIMTGVKMTHVPYKGGAQGIIDLMGGSVQASFSNAINVIPHIRAGKLKGLAITGAKRTASVPQVPTYAEGGLPDYDPKNFQGMLAPAGTPRAIVNKLSDEIRKILQMPQIVERLTNGGMEPYHTGPEKMAAEMKRAYEETARVAKIANIKVDDL